MGRLKRKGKTYKDDRDGGHVPRVVGPRGDARQLVAVLTQGKSQVIGIILQGD